MERVDLIRSEFGPHGFVAPFNSRQCLARRFPPRRFRCADSGRSDSVAWSQAWRFQSRRFL